MTMPVTNYPVAYGVFQKLPIPKTYGELVACDSPKVLPFIKDYGRDALVDIVVNIFSDICDCLRFEVSSKMLYVAAEIIIQDFPDTKISDYKLFGRELIAGNIGGKLFGFDSRIIIECWREYYTNREEAFAYKREENWKAAKREEMGYKEISDEEMKVLYEKAKKDGKEQAKKREDKNKYSKMTLKQICESEKVDYGLLETRQRQMCVERLQGMDINFDLFFSNHLKGIEMEVRRDITKLDQY